MFCRHCYSSSPSLNKEMGDSASPQAAATAPCGFTLCFFVLTIFEGVSGAGVFATTVACSGEVDFGGSGGGRFWWQGQILR